MAKDILNSQIRTNAIITTSSGPIDSAKPKILIYDRSFAADTNGSRSSTLNAFVVNSGNFPTNTLLYIHGIPTTSSDSDILPTAAGEWATMFGGDVIINGTLFTNKLRDGSGNLINFSSISYVAPSNTYESVDISSIWFGGSQPITAGEADGDLALKILENKADILLKADASTVTTLSIVIGTAEDDIIALQTNNTSLTTNINNLTTSTGLSDQTYTAHGSSNFLKSSDFSAFNNNAGLSESLHNADRLLDLAINSNISLTSANTANITTNASNIVTLQTSITALQADVDQNETDADTAIAALQADIDQNETDSDTAIAALQADIDQNESDADTSISLLSGRIDALELDPTTQSALDTAISSLQSDVNQNESDADTAIAALQADIDQNESDADTAIASLQTSLTTEIENRISGDSTLSAQIIALQADVNQNETDGDTAIAALQADVNQNEADADTAIATLQTESTQSQSDIANINSLLDLHESEIGLNVNGLLTSYSNTNFIKNDDAENNISQDTLKEAIEALDRQIKSNKDEIESNDSDITSIENLISSTQSGSGLNANGSYTASNTTNYLSNATSLRDADFKLDSRIRINELAITSLGDLPTTVLELSKIKTSVGTDASGDLVAFNGTTFLDGITVLKTALITLDTAIASKVSNIFELTGIIDDDKLDGRILQYVAEDSSDPNNVIAEHFKYVDSTTGPQGPSGNDGRGISSVTENNNGTFTLNFSDNLNPFTTINLTGNQGEAGAQGIQGLSGDKGDTGDQGPAGSSATIALGNVTTGDAGTNVNITNTGNNSAAVFDFTIPKGDKGDTGDQGLAGTNAPTITDISVSGTTVTTTLSAGGPLSGTYSTSIGDLSDVDLAGLDGANSNDKILKWSVDKFILANDESGNAGGGDITSIAAGTGLDGGATTGDATINIDYLGADNFIKSASDGTSITVDGENDFLVLHDSTDGNVKYIKASQISTTGGTIGSSEDADYTDGLFTDFTSNTSIGTAVDRFNEVLKALAPTPAPSLDQLDVDAGNGATGRLSFGASNDQSGENPAYLTVDNSAGYLAKDLNQEYAPNTSIAGSYRLGIYDGTTIIHGTLNEDVTNDTYSNSIVNYPDNAFGSGDQGSLKLFLNGNEIHSEDLTSFASGDSLNNNSSGFKQLSASISGKFSSDTNFDNFKYRTGSWRVGTADQVNGRNYAQVKHVIGASETVTGFAEWVNDSNNDQISISGKSLTLNKSGSKYLSGIEYHTDISATYSANIDNFYKYIYSDDAITFDESPVGLASFDDFPIPEIDTDHTKQINLSSTTNLIPTDNRIINGTLQTGFNLSHPLKNNIASASTNESVNGILLDNHPVTSTDLSTDFDDEDHRLIDTTNYSTTNIDNDIYNWDSTESLVSNDNGHKTGLITFNSRLYSPKSGDLPNSGDFTNINNNPDYSDITNTNRVWIRKFKNTTVNTVNELLFSMSGNNSTLDDTVNDSNSSNIKVEFKLPQKNGQGETSWMSVASDFDLGDHSNDVSTKCGDETNGVMTLGTISNKFATFGLDEISNGDYVLAKITAPGNWQGYVDSMSVNFTDVVGSTNSSPEVTNIDVEQTGAACKLSFGTSNPITDFTNYTSDVNSNFHTSSDAGNGAGLFNNNQTFTGHINNLTNSDGNNFLQYAFGGDQGNTGTLKLNVNGTDIHVINLAVIPYLTGSQLNANGSGFTDLTSPLPARDSNNRPDYDKLFRTSKFVITNADQRLGYNIAKVIHVTANGNEESNIVTWINDNNVTTPDFTDNGSTTYSIDSSSISSTDKNHLSGIEYYKKVTNIPYEIEVRNLYKNVYSESSDAVKVFDASSSKFNVKSLNQTGVNGTLNADSDTNAGDSTQITSELATINTSNANGAQNEVLKLNAIVSANYIKSLPELSSGTPYVNMNDITIDTKVKHPLTSSLGKTTTGASERATSNKLLQYTVSTTLQSVVEEEFVNETKRIPTGAYAQQADASGGSWDSTSALTDGLMVYDEKLVYPKVDFRDVNEGGSITSPSGNPDYSSQTGTKTFYRIFQNNTTSTQQQFSLQLQGDGTVLSESFSATNIKIFVKIPNTQENQTTGFLNISKDFETDQYSDGDGALSGSLSSTVSSGNTTTNTVSFGVKYLKPSEYFIVKIEADNNWTGYLSNIEIVWS
jgi:hypothetical protein